MGKRRGLTNPGRLCYGQETRPNEPASPLLRARDEDCRGWARCGGLSICHLALQRQWWCHRWRHREGVHEAGRGRRQYDVKMLSNDGCLPLREKAHVHSTTWLGAFGVSRYRLRHRCAAISRAQAAAVAAAWKMMASNLCFAAKTVGCTAKWWSSHRVLEEKISSSLALYDARIICVKFWESSKSDVGYQPSVTNDCGAQFYSNKEQFSFLHLICNQML
jgi:hypothetical protein